MRPLNTPVERPCEHLCRGHTPPDHAVVRATSFQLRVTRLNSRIDVLGQRIRDYHHAFVVEKSIDSDSYKDMVGRTRAELTVAKIERSEAQFQESDVEGLLDFAEHVIGNAAALWTSASAQDRLALQRAFFPDGLTWTGAGFGTTVTCLAFNALPVSKVEKSRMASPPGFEPGFQP